MLMKNRTAYCSFCRKGYRDAGPLVEGPGDVYICGDCIELSQAIIDQERRRRQQSGSPSVPPLELIQEKLETLIGPGQGLKALIAAVQCHYAAFDQRHPVPGKTNCILLIGPTRSSKILLGRALAHILKVPFVHGDRQGLQNALIGLQRSSLLFQLLQVGEFDVEAAQRGIVYVDGVDNTETQAPLLQLLESGWKDDAHGLHIDGAGILFLCGGPFLGLDEIRIRRGRHLEQPITVDDLLAFGVLPELARRFQAIHTVPPLEDEELVRLVSWVDFDGLANGSSE
jgi:ATP-dependent Clp protease ATP-binding subunit ClpX